LFERWAQWSHPKPALQPQCAYCSSYLHENSGTLKQAKVGASDGAEVHH
jgi:hypothetical protein